MLLTAETIKNGFLQQNAYDDVDMFCVPDKQVRILKLIMAFHARALEIIRLGAPLLKIRALPVLEKIVRAKSQVSNEDTAALPELEAELGTEMDELARSYRR